MTEHKLLLAFLVALLSIVFVIVVNFLIIKYSGTPVPTPDIPRKAVTIGKGQPLKYVVFGDSTAVAQGGDYDKGYVVKTATALSQDYQVTYQNFAVSGHTIVDVANKQLPQLSAIRPDVVLVAAGSNDVTHLTRQSTIETKLNIIINKLRMMNPEIKIVLTGSAAMETVTRLPQPTKWLAGIRTNQINGLFDRVATQQKVTFAEIANNTRADFKNHPEYFAQDNFHPNNDGYAIWAEVLNEYLVKALK